MLGRRKKQVPVSRLVIRDEGDHDGDEIRFDEKEIPPGSIVLVVKKGFVAKVNIIKPEDM